MSGLNSTRWVRDAVGQSVYRGDTVAHVSRFGSNVQITPRKVLDIRENGTLKLEPYAAGGRSGEVLPHNVVSIRS